MMGIMGREGRVIEWTGLVDEKKVCAVASNSPNARKRSFIHR